jgi:hypothetical protein
MGTSRVGKTANFTGVVAGVTGLPLVMVMTGTIEMLRA